VAEQRHGPRRLRRVEAAPRLGCVERDRLLADDVLAGRQGRQDHRGVLVRR
jgi:hypothetical protein